MTKSFSDWVGSMVNSIEDLSTTVTKFPGDKLNPMEIRMVMADLVMPNPQTEDDVCAWIDVFTIDVFPTGDVRSAVLSRHIPIEYVKKYNHTYGDEQSLEWLKDFRHRIRNKMLKGVDK